MKRLFILSVVYFIPVVYSFSQLVAPSSFSNDWEIVAARRSGTKLDYASVEGNPYYTLNMVPGEVTMQDGNTMTVPLRYDLYQDEIEFKQDDQVYWVNKKEIKSIKFENELICVDALPRDPNKLVYFFVPKSGEYSLYVRKSVAYHPYVAPKAYADPIPAKFADKKDEYYLKVSGSPLQSISSKKELDKVFSKDKSALDFIKSQKIKANNLADLEKLIDFLNK